jgi:hypothetical protein
MKFLARLLLIWTELAVISRGLEWDSAEDLDFYHKQIAEESQYLQELINPFRSTSSYNLPYAASQTSSTNEPTPGPSSFGAPHHFMMEDHAMSSPTHYYHNIYSSSTEPLVPSPLHSHPSTPGKQFERAPVSTDGKFVESLPTGAFLPEYSMITKERAASKELKIANRFPGPVTSSQNAISHIHHNDVSLSDWIGLKEEETDFHRLVFDSNVFHFPNSKDERFLSRKNMITNTIEKRPVESGLVINRNEIDAFMNPFRNTVKPHPEGNIDEPEGPRSAQLASHKMSVFSDFVEQWKAVYETRLGIDFFKLQKWIESTLQIDGSIVPTEATVTGNMEKHFIAYLFLVDMIITVLHESEPPGLEVNRMDVFRRAVNCFETHTRNMIKDDSFKTLRLKRMDFLWTYITFWFTQDVKYKSNRYLISSYSHQPSLHGAWRRIFNYIFSLSIDGLNEKIKYV